MVIESNYRGRFEKKPISGYMSFSSLGYVVVECVKRPVRWHGKVRVLSDQQMRARRKVLHYLSIYSVPLNITLSILRNLVEFRGISVKH